MTTIEYFVRTLWGMLLMLVPVFMFGGTSALMFFLYYCTPLYAIGIVLSAVQYEREKIVSQNKFKPARRAEWEGGLAPIFIIVNLVKLILFRYPLVSHPIGDKDGIYRRVRIRRFSQQPELAQEWGYSKLNEKALIDLGYIYHTESANKIFAQKRALET